MSVNEFNHKPAVEIVGKTVEHVDEGLRQYMIKVFNYMGLGLLVTAAAAYIAANTAFITWLFNIDTTTRTVSMSGFGYLITFAPLLMIFAFSAVINRGSVAATQTMFWAFSAVMGLSLATVAITYTASSIARVFLITSATFGAMSLYGYSTKRDLTGIGSFLYMGVWGLVIASIVNIFMQSSGLMYAISYIAVAVFTGLTAYDVQNIKNLYYHGNSAESSAKLAVSGALSLYLDFINLFMSLLTIMDDRR